MCIIKKVESNLIYFKYYIEKFKLDKSHKIISILLDYHLLRNYKNEI